MKKIWLLLLFLLLSRLVFADEKINIYSLNNNYNWKFEWAEPIGKDFSTLGFISHYNDDSYFGKAFLFGKVSKDFELGSELVFGSKFQPQVYFGPQVKVKIDSGFSKIRYMMRPTSSPFLGSYTFIPIGNKLWFDMLLNYDFKKITLCEPQLGYKISPATSIFLQYRGGSAYKTEEVVGGLQIRF